MKIKWLVHICGACAGAVITWQTLFSSGVTRFVLLARLVLYALEAFLVMAVGRPHPKATNRSLGPSERLHESIQVVP